MKERAEYVVVYSENDNTYNLSLEDMDKVDKYCENECLGIQFLISAGILRRVIKVMTDLGKTKPYRVENMTAEDVLEELEKAGIRKSIEHDFGIDDYQIVFPLIIKQTYNFLYKV